MSKKEKQIARCPQRLTISGLPSNRLPKVALEEAGTEDRPGARTFCGASIFDAHA
jgi:hypothetical protein